MDLACRGGLQRLYVLFQIRGDSVRAMHLAAAAPTLGFRIPVAEVFSCYRGGNCVFCYKWACAILVDSSWRPRRFSGLVYSESAEDDIEDMYPCATFQEGMITLSLQTYSACMVQRVRQLPEDSIRSNETSCAPDSGHQNNIRNVIWRPSNFIKEVILWQ